MRVYFFGCWNESGHFLHAPRGRRLWDDRVTYYGGAARIHLDGTLAPRRASRALYSYTRPRRLLVDEGALCWAGQFADHDERSRIGWETAEYPQGQFLLHVLDSGFTAIQWWDRCQGDTRGACNSTLLVEGKHTAEEMLAALQEYFPHVVANLERAGVKLVDASPAPDETAGGKDRT